jgi:hypothetical protein
MRATRSSDPAVQASVGYAVNERRAGLAYARLTTTGWRQLLRVRFRVASPAFLCDRAIAYAALTAVSRALYKRGFREVSFMLGDAEFVEEIATGQGVAEALVLSYVGLRCVMNSFAKFTVHAGSTDDLTQRARAEVVLNLAA